MRYLIAAKIQLKHRKDLSKFFFNRFGSGHQAKDDQQRSYNQKIARRKREARFG
jgi:hypothetical protein